MGMVEILEITLLFTVDGAQGGCHREEGLRELLENLLGLEL